MIYWSYCFHCFSVVVVVDPETLVLFRSLIAEICYCCCCWMYCFCSYCCSFCWYCYYFKFSPNRVSISWDIFVAVVAFVVVVVVVVFVVVDVVVVVVDYDDYFVLFFYHRNLPLKFHQNKVNNSWDIADIEFLLWGGDATVAVVIVLFSCCFC